MNVQVSCPVFRCPKTAVARCTGFRKACERYYCQTHTEGTLCDRCASVKQEEMKSNYKRMVEELWRKSYSASLTAGVVALFIVSLLLLAAAAFGFMGSFNRSPLPVVSLLAGAAGLLGSWFWYYAKTREYVRAGSVELDEKYPGFYDYYRQWQEKLDEITSQSIN
jgi:hypothetical protein